MREFLLNPTVEILPIDEATSEQYADIQNDLRRAGTPIPTNDIWIAASAARHGATVVTYDDGFSHISRIGSVILKRS